MKLTGIWLWKLRIKFWRKSATQVYWCRPEIHICILPSQSIDKKKWNAAVEKNGALIFNRYEYLSTLTKWDAVISSDYSLLLALPYRRKFGIKYYTTAPLTHRLQLIGDATETDKRNILQLITRK